MNKEQLKQDVEEMKAFAAVHDRHLQEGMDLRDYFAAKAMCGLLSYYSESYPSEKDKALIDADGARRAYDIADAMMEARKLCN